MHRLLSRRDNACKEWKTMKIFQTGVIRGPNKGKWSYPRKCRDDGKVQYKLQEGGPVLFFCDCLGYGTIQKYHFLSSRLMKISWITTFVQK